MRCYGNAVLFGMGLLVMAGAAPVQSADVTILRGDNAQVVALDEESAQPTVLRGGGSVILPLRGTPGEATNVRSDYARIAAGRTLWLVDESRARLTACYLRDSLYVGKRRIICTGY